MNGAEVQQRGVDATKKTITGLFRLMALLHVAFKDGVQTEDIATIWAKIESDATLKQALLDAYNSAGDASEEVKEISLAEGLDLAIHILSEGSKVYADVK